MLRSRLKETTISFFTIFYLYWPKARINFVHLQLIKFILGVAYDFKP